MLNLQIQNAIKGLEKAAENAKKAGCETYNRDCYSCPFRHDGEHGGFSCLVGKIQRKIDEMESNAEDDE